MFDIQELELEKAHIFKNVYTAVFCTRSWSIIEKVEILHFRKGRYLKDLGEIRRICEIFKETDTFSRYV